MSRLTVYDPRVQPVPESGCWLWVAGLRQKGYADSDRKADGSPRGHRAFWIAKHGPIPAGMVLDHTCRVRSCVNPDHLRVVTPRQNTVENSRNFIAAQVARTHCRRCGTGLVAIGRDGRRGCKPCRQAANRARSLADHTKKR